MNHVLLLVSPRFGFARSLARALEIAREHRAALVAVAVISDADVAALASTLTDVAFVGEKLSAEVAQQIREEQESLAQEQLRSVRRQAEDAGVPVVTRVIVGEPFEAVEQTMAQYPIQWVILAVPPRPWIEKLWGYERKPDWIGELGCCVETVEERS
ncbi:MAG: hypothetical protein KatS3mg077_1100 [Candidatus Binatia bacterium]|nr:MAG: hypothetical protein KatS3mg077_1100 [Candidatus Binatia bacterium]